jgi:N-acylneuraminate cytidylyltransferase
MKTIAIIPARGGSKRIPRKNIKDFCGKPIIVYSIEAAIKSRLFDVVMVSTDDEEIASIARINGAEVPFLRSIKNSDDYATTADVLAEVIKNYNDNNVFFDFCCCLYPTAPFVNSEMLKRSYDFFRESKKDSLIPVVEFSYPPQRGLVLENDKVNFLDDRYELARSQDLKKIYHDSGQFYWIKSDVVVREKRLITKKSTYMILESKNVQDIDNASDWEIAEFKFTYFKSKDSKLDT